MDLITALLTLTLIVILYWWFSRHDPRLPPCPCRPLPIVGHLLYVGKNFRPTFEKWQRKCGNIYSLYMGGSLVIVLNGYQAHKEAFVKNDNITSDRPPAIFDQITSSPDKGIIFTSGAAWKEQRVITMNILRTLGVGRNIIAARVNEQAASMNETLASLKGEATNINHIVTTYVANVICSIIIGETFDHSDVEFVKMCDFMRDLMVSLNGAQIVNYFPNLMHLPGDIFQMKKLQEGSKYIMQNFAAKYVKQKGFDEFNEHALDNYIALYVHEMNKKRSLGQETNLNEENLIRNIYDLFVAGMETSSNTLMWCILYMINNPSVQRKVYEEIENEIGTERNITISDRNQLQYINAVIAEVQRLASIGPLSISHLCTETFSMGGYMIPKGAHIISNLDSILFFEGVWGADPHVFRPERFLDEKGKLHFPEEYVPFSLGKRMCAGEALAKTELFIFFANMMQRFQFVAPDENNPPTLEARVGINATSLPYMVKVLDRKLM